MTEGNKKNNDRLFHIIFVVYCFIIVYFMFVADFFGRTVPYETYRYNLVLFYEIKRFIRWSTVSSVGFWWMIVNVFGNILMFVPIGFFLPKAFKSFNFWGVLTGCFTMICLAEYVQMISHVGILDVDDIFLNMTGVLLGDILHFGYVYINQRKNKKLSQESVNQDVQQV